MIIQCDQCETKYTFDETLLSHGSVKVRCIRCQHVFTVSAAAEAEATIPSAIPETASPQPETAAALNDAAETAPESSVDKATEKPSLHEWNDNGEEFSFAEPDSFSFSDAGKESQPAEEAAPAQEFSFESSVEHTSYESAEQATAEADTQEFSFESMAPDEPQPVEPPGSASVAKAPDTAGGNDEATTEGTAPEAPTEAPQQKMNASAPKAKTSKLVWVFLFIILIAAGAYGYFYVTMGTADVTKMIQNIQQQLTPAPQQPQGSIQVDTSESYYVDNTSCGQLFVIQGKATNKYPAPRSELQVIATLYKEKGAPLINQSTYCGNIIAKDDLKNAQFSQIVKQMKNPFGTALSNVNIAPGQSLPFMVVFNNIPNNITEFAVEAKASKAASAK